MRTLILGGAAAAVVLAVGSVASGVHAMPTGSGLGHAIEDTDLTDQVHCRWGHPHHLRRWGWWDGCYRGLRRGYVVAPFAVHMGPRRFWRRRFW